MRVTRSFGPFQERPFFEGKDIERIATEELRSVDLLPSSPGPIRVERFIEKRFGVTPVYDALPQGVLGYTRFGSTGVEEIVVSRTLAEASGIVDQRRVNTTLAHEAGHGLLHAHLFVVEAFDHALFGDDDVSPGKVLCRDVRDQDAPARRGYDGRWWEVQANMMMGALLLPKALVFECVEPMTEMQGSLGVVVLPREQREIAARVVAEKFDVNPVVGRIRLDKLFASQDEGQLTL